ncbi:hypothetical protein LX36DRAFT_754095 [Colletotrichum falcatum]|nr:hypothetical protein LX36DRAFT_754095 [Colletotrichum falcatum]
MPPFASLATLLAAAVSLVVLSGSASDPALDQAGRNVLGTVLWALGAATATHGACVAAAHSLALESPGLGCVPYSGIAGPVAARVHVFGLGGYGRREWEFVRQMPSRAPDLVRFGGARAWEAARDYLEGLELVK